MELPAFWRVRTAGTRNSFISICGDAGILRRKHYIHRSSRRSFAHLSYDVVSYPTFFRKPQRLLYRPAGINYNNLSVPIQKEISRAFSESPRLLKSAFFNARSVNNKAVTLSDIIVEKNFCIWLKHGTSSRMVFFLTNLLLLATGYLISRDPLVEVGVSLCCIINNTV